MSKLKEIHTSNGSYIVLKKVGEGSFGQVFKVQEKDTGTIRAIKLVKAEDRFGEFMAYTEISILKKLKTCENATSYP